MSPHMWYENLSQVPDWGSHHLTLRRAVVDISTFGVKLIIAQWAKTYIDEPYGRLCKKVGQSMKKRDE